MSFPPWSSPRVDKSPRGVHGLDFEQLRDDRREDQQRAALSDRAPLLDCGFGQHRTPPRLTEGGHLADGRSMKNRTSTGNRTVDRASGAVSPVLFGVFSFSSSTTLLGGTKVGLAVQAFFCVACDWIITNARVSCTVDHLRRGQPIL